MLQDTIIAVIMCTLPSHHVERENRFEQLFHQADSAFESEYQLREKFRKALEEASDEAVRSAAEKTSQQRKEAMKPECNFREIMEELEKQHILIFRKNEKK